MTMKDLAYSAADQKEMKEKYAEMPTDYSGPKYPYGLELSLDEHCLEKLGKSASDFKVGEDMKVAVMFKVNRVSISEQVEGGKHETVGLCVTGMDFAESYSEKADKLYGGKNGKA